MKEILHIETLQPDSRAQRQGIHLLLGIVFIALFIINLFFPRDLWVQDEARYGEIVREMYEEGHWLIPHLNGYPYPDKPPFYFWLAALLIPLLGHTETTFRLLSLLGVGFAAVGVYRLGREMSGILVGLWATLFFLTAFLSLLVGQIVRMDMLLTATAVWAWHYLHRFTRDGHSTALFGFWIFTALSLALKGPIALLFTFAPALFWQVWEHGKASCIRLRCLWGIMGLCLLAGGWIGAVYSLGQGEYLGNIWHKQLIGRAEQK